MEMVLRKNGYVKQNTDTFFKLKDPVSALTHLAGQILAIAGMPALLIKASLEGRSFAEMTGFAVFSLSMILLYGASAAYHSFYFSSDRLNRILKKIDHISIFYLIAGSYTPICLTALKGHGGIILLTSVWSMALLGTVFKAIWVYTPKWVSSVIYIGMGWAVLAVVKTLLQLLSGAAFGWLLAGGILYTAGGVIYSARLKIFKNAWFGNHELFHCLVLAGSFCHYIMMFRYMTAF